MAINSTLSLRSIPPCHCERSAAIHDSEFGLLDCCAALAVTKPMDCRAALAVTGKQIAALRSQ